MITHAADHRTDGSVCNVNDNLSLFKLFFFSHCLRSRKSSKTFTNEPNNGMELGMLYVSLIG